MLAILLVGYILDVLKMVVSKNLLVKGANKMNKIIVINTLVLSVFITVQAMDDTGDTLQVKPRPFEAELATLFEKKESFKSQLESMTEREESLARQIAVLQSSLCSLRPQLYNLARYLQGTTHEIDQVRRLMIQYPDRQSLQDGIASLEQSIADSQARLKELNTGLWTRMRAMIVGSNARENTADSIAKMFKEKIQLERALQAMPE